VATARAARLFGLLAFLLGVVACLTRDPAGLPLTLDNQQYFFVAERAASGVPPHVSLFDSKHQAGMLLSAVAIRIGRGLGLGDVHAARVASIAAGAAAVALAWWVAHAITGTLLAGHLAALAMLSFDGFLGMAAMGARPKVFLVFFLLAASWALCRQRAFWAGSLAALAFLCWQPALLAVAGAALVFALAGGGRSLARLLIGATLTVLLYELYFAAHGALGAQLEQSYWFPARYMTPAVTDVRHHATQLLRLDEGLSVASLLPLGFAAIVVSALAWCALRPARIVEELRAQPGLAYVLLCGAAALAFSLYEYQTYIDGFFVLPYIAVVVAAAAASATKLASRRLSAPGRLLLAGVVLLLFAANARVLPSHAPVGPDLAEQERLAQKVSAMIAEGGGLYAVGCTHLLAMNHTDNYVPFGFFFRGMEAYLADREPGGYRPLRDGAMPETILVSRPFVPGGREWLHAEYRDETPSAFRFQGVRVWRRIHPEPHSSSDPR
jgi:hypothetical protein